MDPKSTADAPVSGLAMCGTCVSNTCAGVVCGPVLASPGCWLDLKHLRACPGSVCLCFSIFSVRGHISWASCNHVCPECCSLRVCSSNILSGDVGCADPRTIPWRINVSILSLYGNHLVNFSNVPRLEPNHRGSTVIGLGWALALFQ